MSSLMDWSNFTHKERLDADLQQYFSCKFYNNRTNLYDIDKIDEYKNNCYNSETLRKLKIFKKYAIQSNKEE